MKKGISIGIIALFIISAVSPIVVGYNSRLINKGLFENNGEQETVFGDPPDEEWNKTFHIPDKTYAIGYCVQITHDGDYIVAGCAGFGYWYDVYLLKVDKEGNELWNRTFGDDGINRSIDIGRWVEVTDDGGYIIVGVRELEYGTQNVWLIKTDENGFEVWNRTYGDLGGGYGLCVKQTNDSGYIICCESGLIKTDIYGNVIWNKTYSYRFTNSLAITNDGGFITTGARGSKLIVIKTDSAGNIEWERKFPSDGGGHFIWGRTVQQTFDGGYIIGGCTDAYGAGKTDYWLIKLNYSGNEEWNRTFGDSYWDYGNYVIQIIDGGYVMGGQKGTGYTTDNHFWLVRTSVNGNPVWSNRYGGQQDGACNCVQQTEDNGYISVGETNPYGGGKCWLIKIGPDKMNNPPSPPNITGPTNGKVGVEYTYTFNSTDDDGDSFIYYVDWGDGSSIEIVYPTWPNPEEPGEGIANHSWDTKGTYMISAIAEDEFGALSDWAYLEVTMPKNQQASNMWFLRWLERFPILQRLLSFPIFNRLLYLPHGYI